LSFILSGHRLDEIFDTAKQNLKSNFFLFPAKGKCQTEKNITAYKIMHQPLTLIYIGKVSDRKTPEGASVTGDDIIIIYSDWSPP
jgi:hypothetical protein